MILNSDILGALSSLPRRGPSTPEPATYPSVWALWRHPYRLQQGETLQHMWSPRGPHASSRMTQTLVGRVFVPIGALQIAAVSLRGWQRVVQLVVRHSYDPRKRNLRHVFLISLNRRLWTPSGSSSLPRKYHPLSSILHATTSTWHSPAAAHRHCPHQQGIYTATSCSSSSDSPTMPLSVPTLTQVTQPWPLRHTHKSLSNLDAGVVVLATGFVSYHCVPESLPTCSLPR